MYGELKESQMGQGINLLLAEADWRRGSEPPKTRELNRPLGDIAGLPIGSRWINGASAAVDDRIETVVIDVPALDGWPTNRLGEMVWEAGERPVYPATGVQAAPTWRIRTGEQTYFVPAIELIRAVFGPTTDFLRLTIEGGVDLWPTGRRAIFDINASGRDPSDPETLRIKAHRALNRREAEIIARILTNDRMRTAFMQVFASKQNSMRDRRPLFPTTIFPFDEPTRWTVETAWTRVTSENPARDTAFVQRLVTAAIASERVWPKSKYVEFQIYDGFIQDWDEDVCRRFHAAAWKDRPALIDRFQDPRLKKLARRLIYFERPDLLDPDIRGQIDRAIWGRLRGNEPDAPGRSYAATLQEFDTLAAEIPIVSLSLASYREHLHAQLSS